MDVHPKQSPESAPLIRTSTITALGTGALRDIGTEDVEAIVCYWHTGSDEHLDFLGIDRARLGTPHDTEQRFTRSIRTGDPSQQTLAFAITLNGDFAGYTLLNRYMPEINYSHWHITNPALRAAGLSTALYPYRIKTYFDVVPIARLIHQTRTRNIGVNRMLDKYVQVAETCYIEDPDGVALPGEFHLRYVFRKDIPRLFEIATRRR